MANIMAADFVPFGLLWTMNMQWTVLWVEGKLPECQRFISARTRKYSVALESGEQRHTAWYLRFHSYHVWWSHSFPLLQCLGVCLSCLKGVDLQLPTKLYCGFRNAGGSFPHPPAPITALRHISMYLAEDHSQEEEGPPLPPAPTSLT